jgi:hypothetical protein
VAEWVSEKVSFQSSSPLISLLFSVKFYGQKDYLLESSIFENPQQDKRTNKKRYEFRRFFFLRMDEMKNSQE